MTKYISLNNAIGSNQFISKLKLYYRNYICFINKEKAAIRCIIKLNKITNYQINLVIKSQQEVSQSELSQAEIFKSEVKLLDSFFHLEKKVQKNINLLIKDSNNVYDFNCILCEDSVDIGTFEKIKIYMKEKEISQNKERKNDFRTNPLISNILNYQAFKKKNQVYNKSMNQSDDKNSNKESFFFDMKYDKYFLYDKQLIDKNNIYDNFFPKNQINKYNDMENKYKEVFKLANDIFKKPFSELDDIMDEIKIIKLNSPSENLSESNKDKKNESNSSIDKQESSDNYANDKNANYKKDIEKNYIKYNQSSKEYNNHRFYNSRNDIDNKKKFHRNKNGGYSSNNSSNNSSFVNDRGRNYIRSRERSSSPNLKHRIDSPPPPHGKYDRYSERNNIVNNNNYYGSNNNINYYYNINNYYRPGNINRWNDGGYHHQRDNSQQNKNDFFGNSSYYNYEGYYNRERRKGNQNYNY